MSVGPLLRGRGARVLALVLLLSSCGSGGDENVTPAEAAGSTDAAVTIDVAESEPDSTTTTAVPDRSATTSAVPDELALADTTSTTEATAAVDEDEAADSTSTTTAPSAASSTTEASADPTTTTSTSTTSTTSTTTTTTVAPAGTGHLSSYSLSDPEFGTEVTVTVSGGTRTITTNALPDHQTGDFPGQGNPNAISAQSLTWVFPATPTWIGTVQEARTPGIALNGVKFAPSTAETATCNSGEEYRIEAIQDTYNLGLDLNNAHVQSTGEYHYHGISPLLVDAYETSEDLVLVGFAADGHLIWYSKSGAYESGYSLVSSTRSGTDCVVSGPGGSTIDLAGTTPDGTYREDWVWSTGSGDLDECNGVVIDGDYSYLVTDEYPFIGRCLRGDVSGVTPNVLDRRRN